MSSVEEELSKLKELFDANFIGSVEFAERKAEILARGRAGAEVSSSVSSGSHGGSSPVSDDTEDYRIHLGVKVGPYNQKTKSMLRVEFFNSADKAAEIRQKAQYYDKNILTLSALLISDLPRPLIDALGNIFGMIVAEVKKESITADAKLFDVIEGSATKYRLSISFKDETTDKLKQLLSTIQEFSLELAGDETASTTAHKATLIAKFGKPTFEALLDIFKSADISAELKLLLGFTREINLETRFASVAKLFEVGKPLRDAFFTSFPVFFHPSLNWEEPLEVFLAKAFTLFITKMNTDKPEEWTQFRPIYELLTQSLLGFEGFALVSGDQVIVGEVPVYFTQFPTVDALPQAVNPQ